MEMMPVYRYMDSYPHGKNVPIHHPTFDATPPNMNADPAMIPIFHGWPYPQNFGYSVPYHTCCSHGNFPGNYGVRAAPSAYLYIPPNQFPCCGYHPAFPQSYPVQYAPPPYDSMKLPRYEFDKSFPNDDGYHCCGCPNHNKNNRSYGDIKVEEQEPDDERKGATSLVPVQLKNHPYGIVWIPPEYIRHNDYMKSDESENSSADKSLQDVRPPEAQLESPSEQEPRVWSGGFPFDMKNLRHLMQDENEKRAQNHQSEDKRGQFPVVWIPHYNRQNEGEEKDHVNEQGSPKSVKEPASSVSFFPMKLSDGGDQVDLPRAVQESPGSQGDSESKERPVCLKSIPVIQIEEPKGKEYSKENSTHRGLKNGEDNADDKASESRAKRRSSSPPKASKSIPVIQIEEPKDKQYSEEDSTHKGLKNGQDIADDKASESSAKRRSSSPPKTSKLPPVCLRVDPLPRKKNGKGTSRSPSPPGSKKGRGEIFKDFPNASAPAESKETAQDLQVHKDSSSSIMDVDTNEKKGNLVEVVKRKNENKDEMMDQSITQSTPKETEKEGDYLGKEEESKEVADATRMTNCEKQAERKKLSEEEAALLIQSAYRGFEVRRWEPLKKLKEIGRVRDKVAEVRNQIHTLESSVELLMDDRQKMIIGETIMSLLLKLDSIQDLHPSVRDIRKSLARELVSLQEKLDSLNINKPEEMTRSESSDDPSVDLGNELSYKENKETEEKLSQDRDAEPIVMEEENKAFKTEAGELPAASNIKFGTAERQEEPSDRRVDVAEAEVVGKKEVKSVPSDQLPTGNSNVETTRQNMPEITYCSSEREGQAQGVEESGLRDSYNELKELPEGVIDEEPAASYVNSPSPVDVVDDMTSVTKAEELNPLNELPLAVTDEAEPNKYEDLPINISAMELSGVVYEGNGTQEDNSEMQGDTDGGDGNKAIVGEPEKEINDCSLSEPQPLESSNETLSVAEPKDWVMMEPEIFGGEVQKPYAMEAGNDTVHAQAEVFVPEGVEQVCQKSQELIQYEVPDQGPGNAASCITPMATSDEVEQMQTKDDIGAMEQTAADDEKLAGEEKGYTEPEILKDADSVETVFDNAELESDIGPVCSPIYVEQGEEAQEFLPASSSASQLSGDEQNAAMDSDRRVMEENRKLREMVEKLIESGKEQLSVISNLTGRVKELEKKLSRKKKVRPNRYRTAASCGRQPNKHVKKTAASAM